jgi:predicted transcriptional regulator YdeE
MKKYQALAAILLGFAAMFCISIPAQAKAQSKASAVNTETQPAFTVVGFSIRTTNQKEAGGNGEIPQIWQRAMQQGLLENIPHRADNNFTVVYTDYTSDQNSDYTYVLGVRVSAVDKVPEGMVAVPVPAGRYAIVESETGPLPQIMPKLWQSIWAMSPKELGGERAFKADYEVYPESFNWQDAQVEVHLGLK